MELRCNRSSGIIWRPNGNTSWTQDQLIPLDKEQKLVSSRSLPKYLKDTYGISIQEYYNIIMFGDKNHTPKCSICGKDLLFYNLSRGYSDYCSTECKYKSLSYNENFKERMKEVMIYENKRRWSDPNYKLRVGTSISNSKKTSTISQIELSFRNLLNHNQEDLDSYFYVIPKLYDPNYAKFGVTRNIYSRYYNQLPPHIRLIKCKRLIAANIERDLKYYLLENSELASESDVISEQFKITALKLVVNKLKELFSFYNLNWEDITWWHD